MTKLGRICLVDSHLTGDIGNNDMQAKNLLDTSYRSHGQGAGNDRAIWLKVLGKASVCILLLGRSDESSITVPCSALQ